MNRGLPPDLEWVVNRREECWRSTEAQSTMNLYSPGDVVEVISKVPDQGREGPVVYPVPSSAADLPQTRVPIWFEDGIREYPAIDVQYTGHRQENVNDLPGVAEYQAGRRKMEQQSATRG